MKTNLVLLLLALTLTNLNPVVAGATGEGSKPLALPDFSKANISSLDTGPNLKMSCKTPEGREIKNGEIGYEACLSAAQMELGRKASGSPGSQPGTSTSLNFKIGD